ncbi:unnamed protein product [Meganyctiphanes norvegica]|uniref:Carbohydrate sulfotransferase n=1 Tax=Meganyctiphanes norvegica TaxID=48144 RepID=A0AAV2PHU2_MEGNR
MSPKGLRDMFQNAWRHRWNLLAGVLFSMLLTIFIHTENETYNPEPDPMIFQEFVEWHTIVDNRFQQRKKNLEENCKKHKNIVILNQTELPYMQTAKSLLVCPISKVGTTTWKTYMFRLIGQHPEKFQHLDMVNDTGHWVHQESKGSISASNKYTDVELMSLLKSVDSPVLYNGYKRFRLITVRPPMERLVSAYKMYYGGFVTEAEMEDLENGGSENEDTSYELGKKRQRRRIPAKKIEVSDKVKEIEVSDKVKEKRQEKDKSRKNKNLTMERWISKSLRNTINRHWKPYDTVCSPCSFEYDYILHLDTFEEDLKFIYGKADLQDKEFNFNIKFHQTRKTNDTNIDHYFSSLSNQLLKNIYLKYRQDFYLFGYELPYYLKQFEKKGK